MRPLALSRRRSRDAATERPAETPPAGVAAAEPAPDRDVTVIGPAARLEGLIVSGGPLRIEGEVNGEVRADGELLIAGTAVVEADVRAASVRIEGVYHGNVEVEGRAEIGPSARVSGGISCTTLVVAEGATFDGTTRMSGGASVIDLPETTAEKEA